MLINSCNLILLTEGFFMLKAAADTTFLRHFFKITLAHHIFFSTRIVMNNNLQTDKV